MPLELRPNCECCDKDLPNGHPEAMICSYECTFCKPCVDDILSNVCPNCGGGFVARPTRPSTERRTGTSIDHQPASENRRYTKYSKEELIEFVSQAKEIPPEER